MKILYVHERFGALADYLRCGKAGFGLFQDLDDLLFGVSLSLQSVLLVVSDNRKNSHSKRFSFSGAPLNL